MQTNDDKSIPHRAARRGVLPLILIALASVLSWLPAAGQLAITEVQSSQSSTPTLRGSDYWELTNFGSNAVDLTEYYFADGAGFSVPYAQNLAVLIQSSSIESLETMVFVDIRTDILTTTDEFRRWWGTNNLSADLKIAVTEWGFGFNQNGEPVSLWHVTPSRVTLVDRVELSKSDPGDSFTYDPLTGLLDRFSVANVNGAFRAATTTDIGSPGRTTGPVALSVVEPPVSVEVDGGMPVTLKVRAIGLPRPRYQWRFNGEPVPNATGPTYAIANANSNHVGEYVVEVSNGITNVLTEAATLDVNFTPSCASIVRPPTDAAVFPGQTATFSVEVRGFPLPAIQWQFDGEDIPNANSTTYAVEGADENRVGFYTVHVSNNLCSTNASAQLDVVPVPKLIITEAMASPSPNTTVPGHDDWWELTNADTNAVNLIEYRFDDNSFLPADAVQVTNNVVIQPGESVVWASMTPEAFRHWWGEENLPEGLQIISYSGNGFSSSQSDAIRLWNATPLNADNFVVSYAVLDTNLVPTLGVSLRCDPDFRDCGIPSIEGEDGAFRAAEGGDIGSPGWTSNAQRVIRPRVTAIRRDASGVHVTWKTQPNRTYELRCRDDLAGSDWFLLRSLLASGDSLTAVDATTGNVSQRFYKVLLVP